MPFILRETLVTPPIESGRKPSAVAGVWAPHARAVEFGTPYTRAQPFMRRSISAAQDELLRVAAFETDWSLLKSTRGRRGPTYIPGAKGPVRRLLYGTPGYPYTRYQPRLKVPPELEFMLTTEPWRIRRVHKFIPMWERAPVAAARFGVSVRDQKLLMDLDDLTKTLTLERQREIMHKCAKVVARWMKKYTPYDPERTEGVHLRDTIFASTGRLGRKFPGRRFG